MAEKKEIESTFSVLSAINCNEHTETKEIKDKDTGRVVARLTYLSWAWAWGIAKKHFPDATFRIYENEQGWNYFNDGRTCWVKTGVTIGGVELIEYLPVMDARNASIPMNRVTSFDVNKAIQRSLTKAIARHGLGLYIYAGEDLPDEYDDKGRDAVNAEIDAANVKKSVPRKKAEPAPAQPYQPMAEEREMKYIAAHARGEKTPNGRDMLTAWAQATHAGPKERAEFISKVENYKINNNLK